MKAIPILLASQLGHNCRECLKEPVTAWAAASRFGSLDVLEVCTPADSVITDAVIAAGGTASRASHWNGHDLTKAKGYKKLMETIDEQRPRHVIFAPPCGADSVIQSTNQRTPEQILELENKQRRAARIHGHVMQAIRYCLSRPWRCEVWLEQPRSNGSWRKGLRQALDNLHTADLDGCQYHLRDPKSGLLIYKPWRFVSSDPAVKELARRCSRNHTHHVSTGTELALTAGYPKMLVTKLVGIFLRKETVDQVWGYFQEADSHHEANALELNVKRKVPDSLRALPATQYRKIEATVAHLHRNLGHCSNRVLVGMLKRARAHPHLVQMAGSTAVRRASR